MNELLSTIESGQKKPHSNNRDASSVRERRSMLLTVCSQPTRTQFLDFFPKPPAATTHRQRHNRTLQTEL
eukprot:3032731-Amphidinium_carterae.1